MTYTHEPGCGHEPVARGFEELKAVLEAAGYAVVKNGGTQIPDDTPTEHGLTDDELIAVRQLIQERYEDPEARERALYEELFLPDRASRDTPPPPARSQWSDLADRMINHLPSAKTEAPTQRIRVDINLDPPDKVAEMELEIAVIKFLGREYGFDKVLLLTSEPLADEEWRQ